MPGSTRDRVPLQHASMIYWARLIFGKRRARMRENSKRQWCETGGSHICVELEFDQSRTKIEVNNYRGIFWRSYFRLIFSIFLPLSNQHLTNVELMWNWSEAMIENADVLYTNLPPISHSLRAARSLDPDVYSWNWSRTNTRARCSFMPNSAQRQTQGGTRAFWCKHALLAFAKGKPVPLF